MVNKFSGGDDVIIKALGNKNGTITNDPPIEREGGKVFYPVIVDPGQLSPFFYPEDALEKVDKQKSVEQLLREKKFSNIENFIQALIYKKLEKPLSNNLYTFYASRTEFQVHQFKPVLKLLNTSKQRLLLADEVGLGKTIEAGIIITEVSARLGELLSRVLIVCPSTLTLKWEIEMQKRFGLGFNAMKKGDLEEFLRRYKEYGGAEKMKGIISLQTLRSNEMIEKLREIKPHFDIVIVDEAHHMKNPATLSSKLGKTLSELSERMLFLSATPLQLGTPDFFNLLHLLIPEEFSDFNLFHDLIKPNEYIYNALRGLRNPRVALKMLKKVEETTQKERFIKNPLYREVIELLSNSNELTKEQKICLQKLLIELNCLSYIFTRTKRRDIETRFLVKREAKVIKVQFTPEEMEFYVAVTDFVSECFTARSNSAQGTSFIVIMPQRRIASCIQTMKDSLDHLIEEKEIKVLPEDNGDVIDLVPDVDEPCKLKDKEISSIRKLKKLANKIGNIDTKFDKFLEALRHLENEDPKAKIIVFSFFKKTLEYLKKRLEATKEYNKKVDLIHGGISIKERQKRIENFRRTNEIKILLSSEVGSEGLDFEFCKVIFNYDLPWNPMRVEQRIGRLDRYGQSNNKILIYNFSMAGTIDDEILNRLYKRIDIFERYIGDLDAILGDEIEMKLTKDMFNLRLTKEQRCQILDKKAENIIRKEKELKDFERDCKKLIGQDEYFNQEIKGIQKKKRFVTPSEVKFFLELFLKQNYKKTTLEPYDTKIPLEPWQIQRLEPWKDNIFVLECDDGFCDFLRRSTTENIEELITKKLESGRTFLTFDNQTACRLEPELLEFITIHHPIMKAIKRYYGENKYIHDTACFCLRGNSKNKGKYFFFIYLLEKIASRKDFVLVPILFNLENTKTHKGNELCDWFLSKIINAKTITVPAYKDELLTKAFDEAGKHFEKIREKEEGGLKKSNETLLDNQIKNIKQATENKIEKTKKIIENLLEQGKSEKHPIIRLHEGTIRKSEIFMKEEIKKLEEKRFVSVGFNLIAGGIVKIIG